MFLLYRFGGTGAWKAPALIRTLVMDSHTFQFHGSSRLESFQNANKHVPGTECTRYSGNAELISSSNNSWICAGELRSRLHIPSTSI
jgi:hypothetical protein